MTSSEILIRHFMTLPIMTEAIALQLCGYYERKRLVKHELLLEQGQQPTYSYFVTQGVLRSFTYNSKGDDITTGFYTEGQYATDFFAFFTHQASRETIQALTNSEVWAISFVNLQHVFHTIPEFREFGRLLLVTQSNHLKTQLLSRTVDTAEARYIKFIKDYQQVLQEVPLRHIATYLGITDTSLSRIRSQLSRSE